MRPHTPRLPRPVSPNPAPFNLNNFGFPPLSHGRAPPERRTPIRPKLVILSRSSSLSGLKRRQHELGIKLTPAENVSKERPGRGWSASPCVDIVGCIEGILFSEFRTPHGAQSWPPPPIAPDRRSVCWSIRGELVSINPSVVLLSVAARNSAPETFTSKLLQRWGRRCTGCVG